MSRDPGIWGTIQSDRSLLLIRFIASALGSDIYKLSLGIKCLRVLADAISLEHDPENFEREWGYSRQNVLFALEVVSDESLIAGYSAGY